MEQPKLLEFEEKQKQEIQEEKPEIQPQAEEKQEEQKDKKEEKEEKQEKEEKEQKEEKVAPAVKLLEEEKEQKEEKEGVKLLEEEKEQKEQKEKEVAKETAKEEEDKKEGKEIKVDKKAIVEGIKLKMDEEAKKMEEDIIKKIKGCKSTAEKVQLALINERMMKRKQLDKQLEKEIEEVTKKFELLAEPLYAEMNAIICGEKPIEEKDLEAIDFINDEDKKQLSGNKKAPIEEYWYKVLTNCEEIAKDIHKKDESALKSLKKLECIKEKGTENFTLVFEFAENEYFNQCTLKKYFEMKDQDNAVSSKCEPKIEWKEGKNLTVKLQKKKQKNKKTGKTRTVTKEIPTESFFNFFTDAAAAEGSVDDEGEDEATMNLNDQTDIALYLIDETIPYSLEYYLGIKKEDYDSDDSDNEDEDNDEDDDSDDDDDKVAKRKKSGGIGGTKKKSEDNIDKKNKKEKKPHKKSGDAKKGAEEKPECKQQ